MIKGITLVKDFKTLICMNSVTYIQISRKWQVSVSMILTQLTKLSISKILLQKCGKLCEFLGLVFTETLAYISILKGELQRENKLISYKRAFKMLENDMYVAGIGQAVLELLSFKVRPGNHQRGISLLQKFSEIFGNMRLVSPKMTSHLTSHNF